MLAISVELLHGTFRGDPDGTANTGERTRGEWPPAPSRLFAALVAADGTRQNCRLTDGAELAWFEQLPPPEIHAHARPWHQSVQPRYVVRHEGSASKKTHQEYVGRTPVLVRPGVRVAPRDACIVYSWKDAAPAMIVVDALKRRAARVGYLGTSDSPVRVRVSTELPQAVCSADSFVPDDSGDAVIDVPGPGDIQLLDRMYDAWREHGASVSRLQFPALGRTTQYRSPASNQPHNLGAVTAWLRLPAAVSGRRVSALATLFKEAVLSHYQHIYGEPPPVLHGHGFSTPGYELARYLALPDVGYRWSRGRIHGLALWLPPGSDEPLRQMSRDAAFAIRRLTGRGIDVSVVPRDDEARPVAASPSRWIRRSQRWVTAVPAIHERRRALDLAEAARWCRHAGLPEPIHVRSVRTPLASGALDLAPVEVNRPNRPALPYSHVELQFAEPIAGPVVIGSGRQRGFGLCIPVDD